MRLLHAASIKVHEFLNDQQVPAYAILSHTWGEDECVLQEMQSPGAKLKKWYAKIRMCCLQAIADGLEWAWVDTCCIDKTSTADLSEAINSMFRYYRSATTCYAFLSDVNNLDELHKSRWFDRGWTLQELVAPKKFRFYSSSWDALGTKTQLANQIETITRIPQQVLLTGNLDNVSIGTKMSWAANRKTTRTEDTAYCLMGIFQVHMPLLYGEGSNAFLRLQQEIIKVSLDPSLFAWGLTSTEELNTDFGGIFAHSPADFKLAGQIEVLEDLPPTTNATFTGNGVSISLPLVEVDQLLFAGLPCVVRGKNEYYLCLALFSWNTSAYARYKKPLLLHGAKRVHSQRSIFIKPPKVMIPQMPLEINTFTIVRMPPTSEYYRLEEVYCMPHARYLAEDGRLILSEIRDSPHAVLYFKDARHKHYRFAIIVGGTTAQPSGPWASCVERVFEDNNITKLFKSGMTKSQLVSFLGRADKNNLVLGEKGLYFKKRLDGRRRADGTSKPDSLVVHIVSGPCNLLERSMFIYVTISPNPAYNRSLVPAWWNYSKFDLPSQD